MEPLSNPNGPTQASYDAIVIGSGYGAGIGASRLARMGLSVCVLERGREIQPGQFPQTLRQSAREFQAELPVGHVGRRTALFDLRVNADISVLVGCGLGGTSLINGNIMLVPDRRVFEDPAWPEELRAEWDTTLAEGYDRARRMLQPVSYPGHPELKKLEAFRTAATALDADCTLPPITVTFEPEAEGNHASVLQSACTLCGDCCSGCNVGAKNTIVMNYLPDAVHHNAQIFTQTIVRHVERHNDAWRVVFQHVDDGGSTFQAVSAPVVVLGAGTLGSTEILMRSTETGLALSPRLGQSFSGNGDVIAFAYNNDIAINGIGVGHPPAVKIEPVGPVIAGLIDLRKGGPLETGMVIQEGAMPSVLAPLLPALMSGAAPLFGDDTDKGDFFEEAARTWRSLIRGAYAGATHHTQTFLVMAHDGAGGRMAIENDRLRLFWPGAGEHPIFKAINETLRQATAATGGTYVANPMWSPLLGRNLVSVHPLGGCGFGSGPDDGVVDHKCRVFATHNTDDNAGSGIHEGLYVMDGSVMPRSLGVNPALTISAVAERAMIHFARDYGLDFTDQRLPGGPRHRV